VRPSTTEPGDSGGFGGYRAYLGSPRENRYLPQGFYEQLATSYDSRFYAQEVLGEYLNVNAGQAYYAFDHMANVTDRATYNPLLALCWSLDFNVNPSAA
jgi:hypothetical protein